MAAKPEACASAPPLETCLHEGWGCIILQRPHKANAYNAPMLESLRSVLRQWCQEGAQALIIKSAQPRFFCAGADKDELGARSGLDAFDLLAREVFAELYAWPGLTIALIEGASRGGGVELALACDIRIVTEQASFAFPELSLGLMPAAGGIGRLTQLVGPGLTKSMVLAGQVLGGSEAHAGGLAAYFCQSGAAASALAEHLARRAASQDKAALLLAKQQCNAAACGSWGREAQVAFEGAAQAFLYERRAQALGKEQHFHG